MIIGMDFGTTNTGAGIFNGDAVRLLPLDTGSPTPTICRTAIYMTRSGDYHLGSTAINTYFEQNVGRPTRYRKVWVGEIEQVFAELPTFYRDVFVYEDEFSPGRLFLSVKTALRNREYYGTVFQSNWYTPSDLVAIFFMGVKMRMEQTLGSPVKEVVLGRPVHFSSDPAEDMIAQSRLLDGAFKAGFEKVYLEYEPVAAALFYESDLREREVVLVFDFGGGTLDFTVMEIGVPAERRVLATGGIPIAGDLFDQRLFRATIPKHLGEGDYFVSRGNRYPIPAHIFDTLTKPHEILGLNTPKNLEMLRSIHQGAVHKEKTQALLHVVASNYALLIFDLVEKVKRQLSTIAEASLVVDAADFSIREKVTRAQFEQAIAQEYEAIRNGLIEVLKKSGLRARDIDRVIRTGGSSQIPLFVELLNTIFGPEKVRAIDTFSSVTSGLAIRGFQIAKGLDTLPVFTPNTRMRSMEQASHTAHEEVEARQIDLSVVLKRIETRDLIKRSSDYVPDYLWLIVSESDVLVFPAQYLASSYAEPHFEIGCNPGLEPHLQTGCKVLHIQKDEQVLMVTNQFKLILAEVGDLYLAQQTSSRDISYSLPLEPGEVVTAISQWSSERLEHSLICMITSSGQGRSFDATLLADYIAKRPYFQLERQYRGAPISLFRVSEQDILLVWTNFARVAKASVDEMRIVTYDLIKTRQGEIVVGARSFPPEDHALVIDESGIWRQIDLDVLPMEGTPSSKGRTLHRGIKSVIDIFSPRQLNQSEVYALSTQARLHHLNTPDTGMRAHQNKPLKATELREDEQILVSWLAPPGRGD